MKQQFYVENKPGAAGVTASAEVSRAQPDGYTLVLAGMGPNITGPAINPKVGYDPINDFTHIAMVAGDSTLFAVNPALGVKTLPELIKLAKSGTVAINCGSPGVGTIGHLSLEQFRRKAGVMNIATSPIAAAVRSRSICSAITSPRHLSPPRQASSRFAAGTIIPLAVTTSERVATLKDVPTFAELGYPGRRVYDLGLARRPAEHAGRDCRQAQRRRPRRSSTRPKCSSDLPRTPC